LLQGVLHCPCSKRAASMTWVGWDPTEGGRFGGASEAGRERDNAGFAREGDGAGFATATVLGS
jgi:hypothetical protein